MKKIYTVKNWYLLALVVYVVSVIVFLTSLSNGNIDALIWSFLGINAGALIFCWVAWNGIIKYRELANKYNELVSKYNELAEPKGVNADG